jgi:predicted CxxxxCH...CXXCH cytochrome family protein
MSIRQSTSPSVHVNQTVDIVFNQGGTYHEINPASGDADDTCQATYCHGAGKSPAWGNTAAALTCDSCHSGSGTNLPDSHTLHYGSGATIATGSDFTPNNNSTHPNYIFTCGVCHDSTSHAGGEVSPEQAAEISFNALIAGSSASYTPDTVSAGSDKGFSYTAGTCGTVYCHSNAQTSPTFVTPTWGGSNPTPATCTWCHNNDAGEAPNNMISGSHDTHINDTDSEVGRDLPCITCHESTVAADNKTISDTSFHVNNTKDININVGVETDCTNIACHSDGNIDAGATTVYNNPTWGVTVLGCVNCCNLNRWNIHRRISTIPACQSGSKCCAGSFQSPGRHICTRFRVMLKHCLSWWLIAFMGNRSFSS